MNSNWLGISGMIKKSFFAYAHSKTRCRVKVGPVLDDNGRLVTDSSKITEVFNKQFSSVFTAEDVSNIPAAEKFFKKPSEEKLVDIKIAAQLVWKKIAGASGRQVPRSR